MVSALILIFAFVAIALGSSAIRVAAAEPSEVRPSPGVSPGPQTKNGYLLLGFDVLASFPFTPPALDNLAEKGSASLRAEEQIPAAVRAWHGRKAVVTGYMLPVKSEGDRVTELLLTRHTIAAGNVNYPTMNEWVIVRIRSGVPPRTLLPVSFFGVFKVGAVFENGYMVAIYEFEAERMSESPGH